MNGDIRREWLEKDYYQVLGVAKNASASDIKKAYRKLAQRYHPDANAGNREAEERFKEISAAYDVLGDQEKRREYDRVRDMVASGYVGTRAGPRGGGTWGAPGGSPFDLDDLGDLGDLFGIFTGRRGRASREERGADLETDVRVSFEDALRGTTVPLRIPGPAPCPTCGGPAPSPARARSPAPSAAGRAASP